NGGTIGNVAIAAHGHLVMSGSTFITGDLRLGPAATYSHSGTSGVGGTVFTNVDLSTEISAAYAAAAHLRALSCTQTLPSLTSVSTINGNGGLNVICVTDAALSGSKVVTLSGGPSDLFVLNITGKVDLSGSSRIVVQGLSPSRVILNVRGTGQDVHLSG